MVATRRAAAVQSLEAAAAAASDSDSDAPEEVTLHTSKNVASEQGKQERGAVRSAQKATKDRRRRLSGKSAPAQSPLDARTDVEEAQQSAQADLDRAAVLNAAETAEVEDPQEEGAPQEDLLPQEVLDALLARQSQAKARAPQTGAMHPAKKRRKDVMPLQNERGTVQLLSRAARPTGASGHAREFLQSRLHGVSQQRSVEMLRKTSIGGQHIYSPAMAYAVPAKMSAN